MKEASAFVHVTLGTSTYLVGRLWSHTARNNESATFEYSQEWLENQDRFGLEPSLVIGTGKFHTAANKSMFGAFGDSAPDRWGRVLMRRGERRKAELENRDTRTLMEFDYLLRVNDESRQGALRFSLDEGGPFVADDADPIPPLVELPRLLNATGRIAEEDSHIDEDLRLLLAPGSSLGGARPKASVRDGKNLAIAKFPHKGDELDAVAWEHLALSLADDAGINVPRCRIERIGNASVLIIDRFDRDGFSRTPFVSAMSMLSANDNETHSYMEIMDVIRQHGADARLDGRELWRRMVFNILISNTDDHLRNHGFLYESTNGWRLSPAYDMNPVSLESSPRIMSTAIDMFDRTASLELALEVAPYFELTADAASKIAKGVGEVTQTWRVRAERAGIAKTELGIMTSAFEHSDLKYALKIVI